MTHSLQDLADTIRDACGDHYDSGKTEYMSMWHEEKIVDAIDWQEVAKDVEWFLQPPTIMNEAMLDKLNWPCIIREKPVDDLDVGPQQIWEFAFQVGWAKAGCMFDPEDQTPRLPAEVIWSDSN